MNSQFNAPPTAPDRQLEKRQTLWILLAMFFVVGWFGAMIPDKSSYYPLYQLVFGLCNTIFVVRWVALDAAQRRFPLTKVWIFFFVFFSWLVVPFYLFQTRGKKSLRPILLGLALLLGYSICAGIGGGVAAVLGLASPEYRAAIMPPGDSK